MFQFLLHKTYNSRRCCCCCCR